MLFREQRGEPAEIQVIEDFYIEANCQLVDPTLRRFDSVWRAKLLEGELPAREDIDPAEITELLPHIMLADVSAKDSGATLEPRLVGQHHLAVNGTVPGKTVMEGRGKGALAFLTLDGVMDRQQPHYSMLRIGGAAGFDAARAVYPLSSDGVTVDRIVSVIVPYYPAASRSIEALIGR